MAFDVFIITKKNAISGWLINDEDRFVSIARGIRFLFSSVWTLPHIYILFIYSHYIFDDLVTYWNQRSYRKLVDVVLISGHRMFNSGCDFCHAIMPWRRWRRVSKLLTTNAANVWCMKCRSVMPSMNTSTNYKVNGWIVCIVACLQWRWWMKPQRSDPECTWVLNAVDVTQFIGKMKESWA